MITVLSRMLRAAPLLFLAAWMTGPMSAFGDKTIAISYFDNTSGDVAFNPLSKGIADMLITDLSKVPALHIVEREKLEQLIREIELGESQYFDQATAQKLGKGLGAEAILTGAFLVLDQQLRIDARLVDVASGSILAAESVSGDKDNFFALHDRLVALLAKAFKMDYRSNAANAGGNIKLDAVVQYSTALDYLDKGLTANAGDLLASTVAHFPGFTFAKTRLESLKEWLVEVEAERERLIHEETRKLLANLDADNAQVGQQINQIWGSLMTSQSYSKLIAINKQLEEKKLPDDFKLYGEASPITFGELRYYYDALSYYMLKDYSNTLTAGEMFIRKYPTSMYFAGVKANMDQAIAELEAREKGQALITESIANAEFETYVNEFDGMGSHWKLDYMTEAMYHRYKELFMQRIFNWGDKQLAAYIESGGEEADALFNFKDIALHFLDAGLLKQIGAKAVTIYGGTALEEQGYRIEQWVDNSMELIEEIKTRNVEAWKIVKGGSADELQRLVRDDRKLRKSLDWALILEISAKFIQVPYSEKNERDIRSAWEMRVIALAHLRNLEEAQKQLEAYNEVKELAAADPKAHTQAYRSLRGGLNEAKKSILALERDGLSRSVYQARADTYRDNHQFVEEAYTRRAMLDRLVLDEDQASLQLYLLLNAYSNMGYFDKARSAAKELAGKYPGSSYIQSAEAVVKYMPE